MKNIKKKGFTLVELIGALAILAIAMTGVSLAFNTSSTTWKNTKLNLELVSYNQSVSQSIRAQGKDKVKKIYNKVKKSEKLNGECYVYFNSYEDIQNGISANNEDYFISSNGTPGYVECSSNNINNKKYGAMIELWDEKSISYYPLFKAKVTVWVFKQGTNAKSESTFYIGR